MVGAWSVGAWSVGRRVLIIPAGIIIIPFKLSPFAVVDVVKLMNIHLPVFHQIVIVSTFNAVSFLTDAGEGAEPGLVPCSGPFFRKKTLAVCNTSMYTSVI